MRFFLFIKSFLLFISERNKRLWSYYLAVITLIILFFYGADFGNFSYNHTRINASALNFAEDPVISFKMLWQSYPMVWIFTALILTVILMASVFKRTHVQTLKRNLKENNIYRRSWHVGAIIFFVLVSLRHIFISAIKMERCIRT